LRHPVAELSLLSGAHATARFFEIESTGANPHAVQHDGELAGEPATFAFFMPVRLASRIAQLLSAPPWIGRVKMI
jgi:hypothetical protein